MASLWQHPHSKFYSACWNTPDGKRIKRSTKQVEKSAAQKLADQWEAESHGLRTLHRPSEAGARKQMAAAVRACRNHYRKAAPNHWRFFVQSAVMQMYQALADCRQLDLYREQQGLERLFVEACTVFNTKAALAGMHCRALNELKAIHGGKTPAFRAMKAGELPLAGEKRLLENIRETIRDGWSEGDALTFHADSIQKMAMEGRSGFFEGLGELLRAHRRDPLRRDLMGWIIRGWLPLCLWECARDGNEALARMAHAAALMGMPFYEVDPLHSPPKDFLNAWRNVRNKRLKV